MMFPSRDVLVLAATVSLAGCGILNGNPYHLEGVSIETGTEGRLSGVAVDAKQRFVWAPRVAVRAVEGGAGSSGSKATTEERTIICAEPSPDALTAIANSIDTELRTDRFGSDGASAQTAARFAGALSETAQTIGNRTQVVQLLRDGLYRACEAYANGALDDFGYALILGQMDAFMLQLLSVDVLGKARGLEEVAEARAKRDAAKLTTDRARGELQAAQRTLAQLDQETRTADESAGALAGLMARRDGLNARRTARVAEKNRLEGPVDAAGSIAHTNGELTKITLAQEKAVHMDAALKRKTEAAKAAPDDSKHSALDEVREAQIAADEARREAEIARSNKALFKDKLERDEAELVKVRNELANIEAELASVEQLVGAKQSAEAAPRPSADVMNAARTAVEGRRKSLADAEAELANTEAALARANEGVGPGPSAVAALDNVVNRSFDSKKVKDISPTRVVQKACLQWFARNPQIIWEASARTIAPSGNGKLPAIAKFCEASLTLVPVSGKVGEDEKSGRTSAETSGG